MGHISLIYTTYMGHICFKYTTYMGHICFIYTTYVSNILAIDIFMAEWMSHIQYMSRIYSIYKHMSQICNIPYVCNIYVTHMPFFQRATQLDVAYCATLPGLLVISIDHKGVTVRFRPQVQYLKLLSIQTPMGSIRIYL